MPKYKYEFKYIYCEKPVNCFVTTNETDIEKVKEIGFKHFGEKGFVSIEL